MRFCDDVIIGEPPILQSLIDLYKKKKGSVVLLERVPMKMVSRFGVVGYKKSGQGLFEINKIVEKPPVKEAPSNLTIVGAYVLMPEVMRNLKMVVDTLPLVADDALPLAVALQIELILKGKIFGWELEPGRRLDCGTLEKLHEAEAILKAPKAQKS